MGWQYTATGVPMVSSAPGIPYYYYEINSVIQANSVWNKLPHNISLIVQVNSIFWVFAVKQMNEAKY